MSIVDSIILGLIQGLTEFLPVSSSGHLVLLEGVLGTKTQGITFEVFVHFGTALAIVTVFWRQICSLITSAFSGIVAARDISQRIKEDEYLRLVILIIIGSVPAGIFGVLFKTQIESAFSSPTLVAFMLLLTGAILWFTRYVRSTGREVSCKDSILIGIAQAAAIVPGISRSGFTISTALYRGVDGNKAAEFSFLLALPAILGATLLKTKELLTAPPLISESTSLIVGTVVAYLSGYIAIRLLLGVVRRGRLDYFSYYCWLIAVLQLVFGR